MPKPCPICRANNTNKERVLNQVDLAKCSDRDFIFADLDNQIIIDANSKYGDQLDLNY
jgi:hypothetical protein